MHLIVRIGITSRSQGNGDRPPATLKRERKRDRDRETAQGRRKREREKVSEKGGEEESGRERDVTRGITWCIDRCAASTRAIPAANLPTYPKHYYPFPSRPVCSRFASPSPPLPSPPPPASSPSPSPFTRLSAPPPFRARASILHRPPLLQQTPCVSLPSLPASPPRSSTPLDETPSDIHRRVSSELIIKCIVVPTPTPRRTPSFHPHRLA